MRQFDPAVGPSWLPPGALMHIDFLVPRAWDGVVDVVLSASSIGYQCLGNDPNTNAYLAPLTTGYDYERIEATGYYYHETWPLPAYISSMRQAVLADCTVVITLASQSDSAPPEIAFVSADGLTGIVAGTNGTADMTVTSRRGPLALSVPGAWVVPTSAEYVRNRYAFTSTAGRFEIAVNGSAAAAGVVDATDRDATVVAIANKGANIESITVYPPLADVTGLSELSSLTEAPPPTGGKPEWVPADATLYIDFLNGGRAWDGTNELDAAGIGALLGADAGVTGTVAFNPAWIETHGLNPPAYETFAFLGAANAALFPAGSLVMGWRHDATLTGRPEITLYSADNSKSMRFYHPDNTWYMYGTGGTLYGSDGPVDHSLNLAPNAGGLTYSGTGDGVDVHISANNAVQLTIPVGEVNIPAASPMVKGKISSSHITSLAFYPVLADLAPVTTPDPPADPNILPLPLIHIDFLADTATNAGATVGIASLLGTDNIAQNSGMPNSYNAALNLGPTGYCTGSDTTWCGFISAAKTAMTEGATIVYKILVDGAGFPLQNITHGYYSNQAAARSLKAILDHTLTTLKLQGDDGVLWVDESDAGAISVVVGEINTVALQIIHTANSMDSIMWVSVNGQPAFGSILPKTNASWSFAYTLFASGKNRIQSIDIYKNIGVAPAMLPALSAPPAAATAQQVRRVHDTWKEGRRNANIGKRNKRGRNAR
jgi:hypothetical protein